MITQERRRINRLPKRLSGRLNSTVYPKQLEISTENITEGGVLIEVAPNEENFFDSIIREKYLLLEIDLYSKSNRFKSLTTICWYKKEKVIYKIGVKFIKMSHSQLKRLSLYITKEIVKTFPVAIRDRVPHYILYSKEISPNLFEKIIGEIMLFFANIWVRRQSSFMKKSYQLLKESTEKLYDFEAKKYLWKHGRTTHRKDDAWRLWLAQSLLPKIKEVNRLDNRAANHLDVFAGTGLSYLSQAKCFCLNNVNVNSLLFDYSTGMLKIAREDTISKIEEAGHVIFIPLNIDEDKKIQIRRKYPRTVELVRGDATNITEDYNDLNSQRESISLQKDYFDVVSIMFGIGAVPLNMALSVSKDFLKVLRVGGNFTITDMHSPVAELAGRWAWPFPMEFRWPWFEKEAYRRVTVPYVLNQLWGWHDPTLYPHLMKLTVIKETDIWYGWKEIYFEIESQTWDFGMPVMPTFKQILKKVKILEEEAKVRIQTTEMLINHLKLGKNLTFTKLNQNKVNN